MAALAAAIFEGGPAPAPPRKFAYGTAGFRAKADTLDVVMYRVGALAALRAAHTGKIVGVMVTASHNEGADNGSKIVDPDGGMLAAAWEEMATALANAGDAAAVEALLVQIAPPPGGSGLVVVGRDTRVSSPHLAALVASGVAAAGGAVHDLGVVTTPQVHWAVLRANQASPPAVPALSGYFQEHVAALLTLLPDCKPIDIVVDCANGCGAKSVFDMQAALAASTLPITLHAFNTGGLGQGDAAPDPAFLNAGCGAEFVQKSKALPRAYEETLAAMGGASAGGIDGKVWASFDGDADRVVCIFVYVCLYVCVYACMRVRVCVYVCVCVCVYVCMYVCMSVCLYVCMDAWMHGCVWSKPYTLCR